MEWKARFLERVLRDYKRNGVYICFTYKLLE